MGEIEHAVVAYLVKNEDGEVGIRLDDAKRKGSTFEQVRLFTLLRCTEDQVRTCNLTDEQFEELGHAIVARLSALLQSGK